jgi:hypothetical protein
LRVAASRVRDTERIGPFLATFSRHSANPYLSYAIPDDGAVPSSGHIDALVAAYQHRGRVPRLEYLPGVAPAVEAALLARGFVVQARLPAMVCVPGGIAGAITAWLAREAFAAGVTCAFLTPVDHDAGRIYARAGFATTASMVLHVCRPSH